MTSRLGYTSRHQREQSLMLQRDLMRKLSGFDPGLLVTTSLYRPRTLSESMIEELRYRDFSELNRELVNRFDKQAYGRKHHKVSDRHKFSYVHRIETVDKFGRPSPPHSHLLIDYEGLLIIEGKRRLKKLEYEIIKLCRLQGYYPSVDMRAHGDVFSDYILKHLNFDVERIYFRHPNFN